MSLGLAEILSGADFALLRKHGLTCDPKVPLPEEAIKEFEELDCTAGTLQEYLSVVNDMFADYLHAANLSDEINPDLNSMSMVAQFLGDISWGLSQMRCGCSTILKNHYQNLTVIADEVDRLKVTKAVQHGS